MSRKACGLLPALCLVIALPALLAQSTGGALPTPQIFAPGVISGPANDGAPTFSPDGNTLFFTRSAAHWTVILESHKVNGEWLKPVLASFSGEWPDSSPEMSPQGTFIIFQSTRPVSPLDPAHMPRPGEPIPGLASNIWRVDKTAAGWSQPVRLPDAVNLASHAIYKPSVSADGTIYLTVIDKQGGKRLYASRHVGGVYQPAEPLSFSDGTMMDVDPAIAADGSFLVFCSAGRIPGDSRDRLFIVRKAQDGWGPVTRLRYEGDDKPYGSTDDEPHLAPDQHTVYFSSDRAAPAHFPRTHEQAAIDLDRLNSWDNSNANVWSISIAP